MFEHFTNEGRNAVAAALDEANRRGDRHIGTEHLLLGVLADPHGACARAVGVGLGEARDALDQLDRDALRGIGIDAELPGPIGSPPSRGWRRPPLTGGAKAAFRRAIREVERSDEPRIGARHLLLGVLGADGHDAALALLDRLDIEVDDLRDRLAPINAA